MFTKLMTVVRQQAFGLLALFVALGGTSYAVATGSIDSREIKNSSVRSKDLRNNDVRSGDVRDGSLLSKDFKAGQLPAGARGPQGDTGTVDTSRFYSKVESDGRFLAAGGKAADADRLDGKDVTDLGSAGATPRSSGSRASGARSTARMAVDRWSGRR